MITVVSQPSLQSFSPGDFSEVIGEEPALSYLYILNTSPMSDVVLVKIYSPNHL